MKIKNPVGEKPEICVIWMHGLGSDALNMFALTEELSLTIPTRHVCLNAPVRPVTLNQGMPMRAWYDIYGLTSGLPEDETGIGQSLTLVQEVFEQQLQEGFKAHEIYLAGFSQGGAMALYAGLHYETLGGIIALSGYLPLAAKIKPRLNRNTPIFVGLGLYDPVVLPVWTHQSVQWLKEHQFPEVALHQYPMEHSVCFEEISEIANWLTIHASSGHRKEFS